MSKARFIILACLSCLAVRLVWAAHNLPSDFKAGFSKRFSFESGKEIPLDAAIGWVRFEGMRVEAKQKKAGLLLKVIVIAHSKASHDHDALVRVRFEDKDGNVLGTALGKEQIEEGDDGKIKAEVVIPGSTAEVVAFTLELAVPGA